MYILLFDFKNSQIQIKDQYFRWWINIWLILDAPEVFVDIDWVHAGEGEAAVLTCRVLANPGPKVRKNRVNWLLNESWDDF